MPGVRDMKTKLYVLYADSYVQETHLFIGVFSSSRKRNVAMKAFLKANSGDWSVNDMVRENVFLDQW
jgi:hypothetical protein